jgi:hypothetical protein
LLFTFVLECAIRKVQETQKGLKSDATHQLLVCADDVNVLGDNINTIRKNTKALTDVNNEAAVAVNAEKTKYKLIFHHKNAGQNHNTNILCSHLLSKNVKIRIYKTLLLYGCKTRSLSLREQHKMWVLRRIFVAKIDAMVRSWREPS